MVKLVARGVEQTTHALKVNDLTIGVGLSFDGDAGAKAVPVNTRVRVPLGVVVQGVGRIKIEFTR